MYFLQVFIFKLIIDLSFTLIQFFILYALIDKRDYIYYMLNNLKNANYLINFYVFYKKNVRSVM